MLLFKWHRFIFILIALEFMMMRLFIKFVGSVSEILFFYFMCFSVVSRIMGIVVIVGRMKFFGDDSCIYYRFKLN